MESWLTIPSKKIELKIKNDFNEIWAFLDSLGYNAIGMVLHIKGIGHLIIQNVTMCEEEICIICR